jgi:hypothetical protein
MEEPRTSGALLYARVMRQDAETPLLLVEGGSSGIAWGKPEVLARGDAFGERVI